ncbi:MAG: hypothetical protein HY350_04380, partial [Candidatus Omnitrophica bacterium]|nr:hypothetical protein [Candidatus Omnitrophota bacterium]
MKEKPVETSIAIKERGRQEMGKTNWKNFGLYIAAGLLLMSPFFYAYGALSNLAVVTRDMAGTETSGTTGTITPDWDGNNDYAIIEFTTDRQGNFNVSCDIDIDGDSAFDGANDVRFSFSLTGPGQASFWWEGRSNNGNTVANGTYNVRVG